MKERQTKVYFRWDSGDARDSHAERGLVVSPSGGSKLAFASVCLFFEGLLSFSHSHDLLFDSGRDKKLFCSV